MKATLFSQVNALLTCPLHPETATAGTRLKSLARASLARDRRYAPSTSFTLTTLKKNTKNTQAKMYSMHGMSCRRYMYKSEESSAMLPENPAVIRQLRIILTPRPIHKYA